MYLANSTESFDPLERHPYKPNPSTFGETYKSRVDARALTNLVAISEEFEAWYFPTACRMPLPRSYCGWMVTRFLKRSKTPLYLL